MSGVTELVLKSASKREIATMLNERWKQGWILDRIIDHGDTTEQANILIYYFVRSG